MTDPSFDDVRRQVSVVLAAIEQAPDAAAREAILLDFCSKVRQDAFDEIVRRMNVKEG